jgi:hypothetical protein
MIILKGSNESDKEILETNKIGSDFMCFCSILFRADLV